MALSADRGELVARARARRRRRRELELTAILAGSPPGVLSLAGGFPNARTFATDVIDEIAARVVREDAAVALQYTPCEGIPSVREYLLDRQEQLQGRRPPLAELIVTSGGMECITLACRALIDPGDPLLVEDPTYLGALMAFDGFEARVEGVPMDAGGLRVDALAERLAAGPPPKLLYVIPEYQNPTGRTLPLDRRAGARRAVPPAPRADPGGHRLPRAGLRRHVAADAVVARTRRRGPGRDVLEGLLPRRAARLGGRPGRGGRALAAAKQTTDQCAGGLGQRMLEEYGRAGHFERQLPAARALYASHWRAVERALREHLPPGCTWTEPTGGFLTS